MNRHVECTVSRTRQQVYILHRYRREHIHSTMNGLLSTEYLLRRASSTMLKIAPHLICIATTCPSYCSVSGFLDQWLFGAVHDKQFTLRVQSRLVLGAKVNDSIPFLNFHLTASHVFAAYYAVILPYWRYFRWNLVYNTVIYAYNTRFLRGGWAY